MQRLYGAAGGAWMRGWPWRFPGAGGFPGDALSGFSGPEEGPPPQQGGVD